MKSYGQLCAVARALDVVGDRWTLLIVRELLIGGSARYSEIARGLPGIAPNLLSQRLRDLERDGVLERDDGEETDGRPRYRLTARGRRLEGVVRELLRWGAPTVPDAPPDALFRMHWLSLPARVLLRDATGRAEPTTIRFGDLADGFDVIAADGEIRVRPCDPAADPAATVSGPGPAMVGLVQGALPLENTAATGIRIDGDAAALRRILPSATE